MIARIRKSCERVSFHLPLLLKSIITTRKVGDNPPTMLEINLAEDIALVLSFGLGEIAVLKLQNGTSPRV